MIRNFMAFRKIILQLLAFITGMLFLLQSVSAQTDSAAILHHEAPVAIDTLIPSLVSKVASYTFIIDRNTFQIRRKFNMAPIAADMPAIERSIKGFKTRLEVRGRQMNLRSLNSGTILLGELSDKLTAYQKSLSIYNTQLIKSNAEVKKIINDTALHLEVPDTALAEQMKDLHTEGLSLDSLQRSVLIKVLLLRNRVSINLLQANDIMSDMGYLSTALKLNMWQQEEPPLFSADKNDYHQSLLQITTTALQRSYRIISIYLNGKWNVFTYTVLLFIFITVWCMLNLRRIKKLDNASAILAPVYVLPRSVLIGCMLGYFTYAPLFFANPTMSYLHANELFRHATLFMLIFPFLTKPSKAAWILLCILWLYYALDDVLLEAAYGERWGLFIAGIVLTVLCVLLVLNRKGYFVKIGESTVSKPLIIFTMTQALASVAFNLSGHLILAKIFGISAVQCLMLGISLKIFCTMVLEAIYLQSEAHHESRFSHFINYNQLQNRFRKILWILAMIVWGIALIRNFTFYDLMTQVAGHFFTMPRSIGNMTFTFQNVVVFVFIIWLSSFISKSINFFFAYEHSNKDKKRNGVGSVMLLVRLGVWSLGFLIAVAAAGIPVDRLSLMLGALGVGIGFGLQNIVNNLVSGVIIAFERPIQIGDQIEIGNKAGIVQEIGVRSSKIKSSEGADIIIPNGDLLSQHLINWTMQDRSKRVEFIIGLPYDADIRMANTLIQETLAKNNRILQPPIPVIILQAFTNETVTVRIMFWVPDLSVAGSVKSTVMLEIYEALTSAGIQLPLGKK